MTVLPTMLKSLNDVVNQAKAKTGAEGGPRPRGQGARGEVKEGAATEATIPNIIVQGHLSP